MLPKQQSQDIQCRLNTVQSALSTRAGRERKHLLIIAIVVAFPVLLLAWRKSLDIPFFAVSGDDLHRVLYSWEVSQGNLLPSDLWPPLQFWIQAVVLRMYPHILTVPTLVNVAASTATLACLLLLGRTLGLNNRGLLFQATITTAMPWYVWLSLSGLGEPLFFSSLLWRISILPAGTTPVQSKNSGSHPSVSWQPVWFALMPGDTFMVLQSRTFISM